MPLGNCWWQLELAALDDSIRRFGSLFPALRQHGCQPIADESCPEQICSTANFSSRTPKAAAQHGCSTASMAMTIGSFIQLTGCHVQTSCVLVRRG